MSEIKNIKSFEEMDENDPIRVGIDARNLVSKKLSEFIQDMRELGQTEIAACCDSYEIVLKIKPAEKQ